MLIALTAASALVPSILLMWYFHSRDLYPEPPRVLWRVFALGIVIVVPIVLVAWPFDLAIEGLESPTGHGFATAFLTAAIPEELFKFLVLWLYAAKHAEFDEPMDGVVYGVTASLGFATFENILYVAPAGFGVAAIRAVTAVPSHAFGGAIMGYFVGRAWLEPERRRRWLLRAIAIPTLLHGLYNFPLMAGQRAAELELEPGAILPILTLLVPLIVVFEGLWTRRITRRLRAEQDGPIAHPSALPVRAPGRAASAAITVAGAILTLGGALLLLAFAVALLSGEIPRDERLGVVVAGVIVGVAPTGLGGFLFALGIRRLNAHAPARQTARTGA